ncbi:hypothetical protein LPB86_15205 [Pedobacter sp. MC2016-14]|uniref:hypothetical protein n=1 Tax=Pedobacter sp. MC2016-14 TaxID=2897327 RepID=UPI001E4C068B|nr:hypothetical protein [Pedobacter sp. MC2016-14]MCD0489588.1 hypothetical protein [Pedobacter sp. MC2016-14]
MKTIYTTIFVLLLAMLYMAWFYFNNLDKRTSINDTSIYAATCNSGIVVRIQNDKSTFDILKGQQLFKNIIGEAKFKTLSTLETTFTSSPELFRCFDQQNSYISILPGEKGEMDLLLSTQLNETEDQKKLEEILKSSDFKIENIPPLKKITIADSSSFYLASTDHLVMISNSFEQVTKVLNQLKERKDNPFFEFLKENSNARKSNLANLFINFNKIPELLKTISTGINGDLIVLKNLNAFASLNYNFSKERLLFNGSTLLTDPDNYHQLFSNLLPQKTIIDNILPENTANYTLYAIESYSSWRKSLNLWLSKQKSKNIHNFSQTLSKKYHINMEESIPKYTKNQFITFQLNTGEKLGAVNLTNGDKLEQQLLDISDSYTDEIRLFKEADLLYFYFGSAFQKFKRPYYVIIDNYLIFSNYASTLQNFLSHYKSNNLLINTNTYVAAVNQLSATANVVFYLNNNQSEAIFRNNLLSPFYKHYRSKDGLRPFETLTWQLSGDKGKFQTNLLLNTKEEQKLIDTVVSITQ